MCLRVYGYGLWWQLLGHQLRVKQLLDAHPPTREDFSLVTSRAAARTAFVAATTAAAGDAADARAIRTAAAKFAEALPMPDGANGQGVSYFMIRDHSTTYAAASAGAGLLGVAVACGCSLWL